MKVPFLLVALALFFASAARADESPTVAVIAPSQMNANEFSFASRFAEGVSVTLTPSDDGMRTLRVDGCGRVSQRSFSTRFPDGYILVVYELGDGRQSDDSCTLSFNVVLSSDRMPSESFSAQTIGVLFIDGRFGLVP